MSITRWSSHYTYTLTALSNGMYTTDTVDVDPSCSVEFPVWAAHTAPATTTKTANTATTPPHAPQLPECTCAAFHHNAANGDWCWLVDDGSQVGGSGCTLLDGGVAPADWQWARCRHYGAERLDCSHHAGDTSDDDTFSAVAGGNLDAHTVAGGRLDGSRRARMLSSTNVPVQHMHAPAAKTMNTGTGTGKVRRVGPTSGQTQLAASSGPSLQQRWNWMAKKLKEHEVQ